MHLLFYGQNSYEIEKKLSIIRDKFFLSDPSRINYSEIDGENLDWAKFSSIVFAAPFLSTNRLIVIKSFLSGSKDLELQKKIANSLPEIPQTSVVLFIEKGLPDQRTTLFKSLNKPKISQKFDILSDQDFIKWVKNKFQGLGLEIERNALSKLNIYLEGDQWSGENEIAKLTLYAMSKKTNIVTESDVELLVAPKRFANVFDFVSAIAKKDMKQAISSLNVLRENGEADLYIFSMITYQFRIMLKIADLLRKKIPNIKIASKAKLKPFVVSKTIPLLQNFSSDQLKNAYLKIAETDIKIKSGQGETADLLPLLIFDFCSS